MTRNNRGMFFIITAMVLMVSFSSYGYKIYASENQIEKKIQVIRGAGPEEINIETTTGSGGYLGVEIADVSADDLTRYGLEKEEGVAVKSVEKSSPAQDAGIQEGDVILSIMGMPVYSAAQFRRVVMETPTGRKVALTVVRSKKKLELLAKIGKRESPSEGYTVMRRAQRQVGPNIERILPNGGLFQFHGENMGLLNPKPRLGISAIPMTDQLEPKYGIKDGGVLVTEVNKESVAAKAGILAGDVITEVDGSRVREIEDISKALDHVSGRSFEIKIARDQKALTLKAQLPEDETKEKKKSTRIEL